MENIAMKPEFSLDIKGYQNLRLIRSQGSMSSIYHGTRIETGQEVIIKLMPAPKNQQEVLRFQHRFNQEILIARLSANNHLLAATDHGDIPIRSSNEPRLYLVYPYIEHGSLADLLTFDKLWETWELPHITDVIAQAAEGLFHLHKSGIVHQDIKPNNFLWIPTDVVRNPLRRIHIWLIDFGVAEPERKGKTRDIKGTLRYLAPEQVDGDIKFSVDQYALALLARLLLTGHEPPLLNESPSRLFTRPTQLNPRRLFEPEIDHVLLKALTPDPESRFGSVVEFAQALQTAVLKQIRLNSHTTLPNPSLPLSRQQFANAPMLPAPSQQQFANAPMLPAPSQQPLVNMPVQSEPSQQQLSNVTVQLAPPIQEELSIQSSLSIPVAPEEAIVLPPLNSPKAYVPPRPRDGSQSKIAIRNKDSGPSLPSIAAHKWLTIKLPDTLRMLTWSPNGEELACTFYHDLPQLINFKRSAETLLNFPHAHTTCWSPDGHFLAISMHDEDNPRAEIHFCDLRAPKGRHRMLVFHQSEPIRGLDWSPKGLFAIWLDHKLLVYDLSKISIQRHLPDLSYTFPLGDSMSCDQLTVLRWSPDGEWLAASSNNGQIVCWQPHTAKYLRLQPLKKNIRSVNWSPNGKILIVAFANKQVLFWNLQTGQISQAALPENPRMVSVSTQTGQIAVATEKTLFFFEHIGALVPTATHPGQLFAAFSPDNKLATLDQHDGTELIIWQI
jgi:serine/threonine protein kinase